MTQASRVGDRFLSESAATLPTMLRRFREGWTSLSFVLWRAARGFRSPVAERLLIAPQELEIGDPSVAISFYSGHLMFAGRTAQTRGQSPFRIEPPTPAWALDLHGFSWLRHFRDSENPVVRHHARALVDDWLSIRDFRSAPVAMTPEVAARRMLSWLVNSPLLLTDADHDFYRRFMKRLSKLAQWLEFCAGRHGFGMARATAAIAYASYTLCALTGENDWKKAGKLLAAALSDTVLADGCPISRNPADALALAADLLPLRTAYTARGRSAPPEFQVALDRLMGFLRLMRHTEGSLALFNGMGTTSFNLLGAVLAFDHAKADTPGAARYGGFQRLDCEGTLLLCDVGDCPPHEAAATAHAGALSFELSAGAERIIVNCGAPPAGLTDLREALRETAAHSTLSVDGFSSARFHAARDGTGAIRRELRDTGGRPTVSRETTGDSERLVLSHDGYGKAFGLVHHRTLDLAFEGGRLSGLDRFDAGGDAPGGLPTALLRFHLHPRVTPALLSDGVSIRLDLADGTFWIFEADGLAVALEDSIFLGGLFPRPDLRFRQDRPDRPWHGARRARRRAGLHRRHLQALKDAGMPGRRGLGCHRLSRDDGRARENAAPQGAWRPARPARPPRA
jgi:uncharacterized heparinase superfamily protein